MRNRQRAPRAYLALLITPTLHCAPGRTRLCHPCAYVSAGSISAGLTRTAAANPPKDCADFPIRPMNLSGRTHPLVPGDRPRYEDFRYLPVFPDISRHPPISQRFAPRTPAFPHSISNPGARPACADPCRTCFIRPVNPSVLNRSRFKKLATNALRSVILLPRAPFRSITRSQYSKSSACQSTGGIKFLL